MTGGGSVCRHARAPRLHVNCGDVALCVAPLLCPGSGGVGHFHGGCGVVREIEFRTPMTVSVLSERRSFQPYGLAGGGPGFRGVNHLVRDGGRTLNLGGKATVPVQPWDRIRILTPGQALCGRLCRERGAVLLAS